MRWALLSAVLMVAAACDVPDEVTPTDAPIAGTTTVYELLIVSDVEEAFNVVFVPDGSYGDVTQLANRQAFVTDVASAIENSYWQIQAYFFGLFKFNYYYMTATGSVTENPRDAEGRFVCPTVTWPAAVNTDGAFADQLVILHANELRDCGGGGRASAEPTSYRTIVHETGHGLFLLPDEYCDDGGYWEMPPVLYASEAACNGDAANAAWRDCQPCPTASGTTWWRSQGHITTNLIMRNAGDEVWEAGPADWAVMSAAYQALGGLGAATPTVFAPDRWDYTIPSP